VCRAWHKAAVAASTDVSLIDFSDYLTWEENMNKVRSLTDWLLKYGSAVQRLQVSALALVDHNTNPGVNLVGLQLPFSQLRQLQSLSCYGFMLQQHPADPASGSSNSSSSSSSGSSNSSLSVLTSLTELNLEDVELDRDDSIASVSALTGLRELRLCSVNVDHDLLCLGSLLPLRQLTSLDVMHGPYSDDDAAATLVQLTGLRSLHLDTGFSVAEIAGFSVLTFLTELHCTFHTQHQVAGGYACIEKRSARVHIVSAVSPEMLWVKHAG
jgi:hypothetical protein